MNWHDRTEVKKGDVGERIVKNYLESKGGVVYKPITNKAHHFDMLFSYNKTQTIVIEVKTQERLNRYKETGITISHYKDYLRIKNIPVYLFFVDYSTKTVYGNSLDILSQEYLKDDKMFPFEREGSSGTRVNFHLDTMKTYTKLSDLEIEELKRFTTKKEKYKI